MGLFDKFKKPVVAEAAPDDLDFMGAIEAHIRWKVRLESYISGESNEQLDPAVVGKDDQCALGKWIHGPGGAKYDGLPVFQSLRETHAGFHQCAAQVIESVDAGDIEKAGEILSRGCYARHSNKVKAELARLSIELGSIE
ncbi:MAG: CZB domain-containing protein [Sulfuricella denitrificans]|nr:CZB domain-containing protein [Sulfuricella denitrificans]